MCFTMGLKHDGWCLVDGKLDRAHGHPGVNEHGLDDVLDMGRVGGAVAGLDEEPLWRTWHPDDEAVGVICRGRLPPQG